MNFYGSFKSILVLTGAGISAESGLETFRGGGDAYGPADFFDETTQVEFDRTQLEFAGVNLREVEEVVDEMEEALGALVAEGDEFSLLGIELRVKQQIIDAQNAIQGGTNLVADCG